MGNETQQRVTQAELVRLRERRLAQQVERIERVDALVQDGDRLGRELGEGLSSLKRTGAELEQLEQSRSDEGLLATLTRPFTARRHALARRSVAEELIAVYEKASVKLREASAFSDELRLCSLELQQDVDRLHSELDKAKAGERVAAERVLACEAALDELEDVSRSADEAQRRTDRYEFDLKSEGVHVLLYQTAAEQCRVHIGPTRSLRDTILQMHEDMALYVVNATHALNAAGSRVQGLGVMADAPVVVQELQNSLDELGAAMDATELYIAHSQHLVREILPRLNHDLRDQQAEEASKLQVQLEAMDRGRAHALAEQALRDAAAEEVNALMEGPE